MLGWVFKDIIVFCFVLYLDIIKFMVFVLSNIVFMIFKWMYVRWWLVLLFMFMLKILCLRVFVMDVSLLRIIGFLVVWLFFIINVIFMNIFDLN